MFSIVFFFFFFALPTYLEEFNAYQNRDKMFPDPVERNNRSLPGPAEDAFLIESDEDEEQSILFCMN